MNRECPACSGVDSRPFGEKAGHALKQCLRCATLFADCGPAPDVLYDDYYAESEVPAFMNARLDQIVRAFERYRRLNRLLDVGFGAGSMLDAAARAGWQVQGVEVSGKAVEEVKKRHPGVVKGTLASAAFEPHSFDVVIASELLEHLEDPYTFVVDVRRILRPGGVLWATTPHGRGITARLLGTSWSVIAPPDHLQLFSVRGVRALLDRAGFRQTHVDTHGADPAEIRRAVRLKLHPQAASESFNRVQSLQQMNRVFIQTRSGHAVKTTINALLNAGRLGDSLKIFAEA